MSVLEILSKIQDQVTSELRSVYSEDGPGHITCRTNDNIVKIVMDSGLVQAAENISDSELKVFASVMDKNISAMNSALGSLTCAKQGGRRRRRGGGSDDDVLVFVDGKSSGGSGKGRGVRRRPAAQKSTEEEEGEDGEEDDISVGDTSGSADSRQAPMSAPAQLGNRDANFGYAPATPRSRTGERTGRPGSREIGDPMPSSIGQAQDMIGDLDNYQILSLFYLALINGALIGTGAYSAMIDTVAGGIGSAVGLPDLQSVCGLGNRQVRDYASQYARFGMDCQTAQQRWEQLLISLGICTFAILAVLSSRLSRRVDSSAISRGPRAMIYELSMSGVNSLGDYLRGVPKGSAPPTEERRSQLQRVLSNPIDGLARLAGGLQRSAANLWSSRARAAETPQRRADPPALLQDAVTVEDTTISATPGTPVRAQDTDELRRRRLEYLAQRQQSERERSDSLSSISDGEEGEEKEGGRKRRKTHRRKAKKAKKVRTTRKKAPKRKTVKAKKAKKTKKAKKAHKTRRR